MLSHAGWDLHLWDQEVAHDHAQQHPGHMEGHVVLFRGVRRAIVSRFEVCGNGVLKLIPMTDPWGWYLPTFACFCFYGKLVGKYTVRPMDPSWDIWYTVNICKHVLWFLCVCVCDVNIYSMPQCRFSRILQNSGRNEIHGKCRFH